MKVRSAAYAEWGSVDELRELLRDGGLPRPFLFVGAGSNLLFTGDFPGTVLHSAMRDIRILSGFGTDGCSGAAPDGSASERDNAAAEVLVEVGAGVVFDDLCAWAAERGFWGIENLSHIPGEVGASAVQNVGAYGVEAKDVIVRVNCIEIATGRAVTLDNADCGYGYRASNFKTIWKGLYAVTSVVFRLSSVPTPRLDYGHLRAAVEAARQSSGVTVQTSSGEAAQHSSDITAQTFSGTATRESGTETARSIPAAVTPALIREVVTEIRRQKLPEPSELGSAGSFFKNPVIPQEHFNRILNDFRAANGPEATVPHYPVTQPDASAPQPGGSVSRSDGFVLQPDASASQSNGSAPMIKIPAAWLIEQCGWKGRQTGNVACYSGQPLVIVNLTGKAAPKEVIELENAVIASVRDRFGITLSPEVEHI